MSPYAQTKNVELPFNVTTPTLPTVEQVEGWISYKTKETAWNAADHILPMDHIYWLYINYHVAIFIGLCVLVFLYFFYRKMANFFWALQIFLITLMVLSFYAIFTVGFFANYMR